MRKTFANVMAEHAAKDKSIYVVTGDAGFGVFEDYKDKFSKQYINTGVNEQFMIGYSAGMSLEGYNVFVYNIVPFVLYRCYEQVRNDICYQQLPITMIGIACGLLNTLSGMTHSTPEDLNICASLPYLEVFSPCDPKETEAAVRYAVTAKNPIYIRIDKNGEPTLNQNKIIDIKKPQVLMEGSDIAVVFHGTIGEEMIKAGKLIKEAGYSAEIISVPYIQPLDPEPMLKLTKKFKDIIVVEDSYINGGLYSRIAMSKELQPYLKQFHPRAVHFEYFYEILSRNSYRKKYGSDSESVKNLAVSLLK
ncbi:MAG: transketolase [Spirochaetes bacterium]|nr:transketolase [Spirochaetota bacterium]